MLELRNIKKKYQLGDNQIDVLKRLSIKFRPNEFVAILGPSGCGKTTLLNIIGGLDHYSSGDLIINDVSTKKYKDYDWDVYRNHTIGFVFQNYYLISHQTVLKNVELALDINGMSKKERKNMAKKALREVGLGDQLNKLPNQLSGGQMQRVAIARALVNNPDIILADEPTGALDSQTSIKIMDLLKKIANDKLVIMVTHNNQLAEKYAERIINILDGDIVNDSHPLSNEEPIDLKEKKVNKSHMPLKIAFKLSLNNLLSKKKRTFITCLASSIGIIGISTILAVSYGMKKYVTDLEKDSTSFNYLTISDTYFDPAVFKSKESNKDKQLKSFNNQVSVVYPFNDVNNQGMSMALKKQNITPEYINYIKKKTKGDVVSVQYSYSLKMNLLAKNKTSQINTIYPSIWQEILDNQNYLTKDYTVLASINKDNKIPIKAQEIVLVVDEYNRVPTDILDAIGINYGNGSIDYQNILGKEIKVVLNNDYYLAKKGLYLQPSTAKELQNAYQRGNSLKIVSILRIKKDATNDWLKPGLAYSTALTKFILKDSQNSNVVMAQINNKQTDVTNGLTFIENNQNLNNHSFSINNSGNQNSNRITYDERINMLGGKNIPNSLTIYPRSYDAKASIVKALDKWNKDNPNDGVKYVDISNIMITMLDSIINIISYVLIAFSSISLIVSSIMIAIVIYNSVIERIKEIGILRAMGARKKDISHIFNAEAVIIGFFSGLVAVIFSWLICFIINTILKKVIDVSTIANLRPKIMLEMIFLSIILTLIASIIPAKMASKKDPVIALRTD